MVIDVPSTTSVVCSAASASVRNGSFTVSEAQRPSRPAFSAKDARAGTAARFDPIPVSIFTGVPLFPIAPDSGPDL